MRVGKGMVYVNQGMMLKMKSKNIDAKGVHITQGFNESF